MRIFFTVIIVLLGVNFGIELMNSSMVDLIKERNNQLERAIDQMWRPARCPPFAPFAPNLCHTYSMENKANDSMISLLQSPAFIGASQGLQEFVLDMNADIDMAYDWVCDQAECSSFVADGPAWDLFYDMWDSTQGLDDWN